MTENEQLLYGKDITQRIVSIEPQDGGVVLFIEEKTGEVKSQVVPNKLWVLVSRRPNKKYVRLKGNLHYSYGCQFSKKEDFLSHLNFLRKSNIDHYTIWDERENFQVNKGVTYFKGMKHNEPSILSFDIETTGLYHNKDSKVLLISNTFRKNGVMEERLFSYDEYETEADLINDWCNWVREKNPALVTGHNIYTFDLPYLNFIAERAGTSLYLGRDGSPVVFKSKPSSFRIDGSRSQDYYQARIYGREIIDTMFLSIRYDAFSKKYESYGLKNIIKQEGLEREDRVLYDASKIRFNYKDKEEFEKIKEYCRHDSEDSLKLYDLMIAPNFYSAQYIPKSFQQLLTSATGSQMNAMMVRSYLQFGHSIPKATPTKQYEGAISLGNPGIYSNCMKWDVASLYPSIILECDVYDPVKDPKGNFLKIMKFFTEERLKNKALAKTSKYHDDLQASAKIFINSGYGFLGAEGLNFNCPDAAEFITKTGREILTIAMEWADSKGFVLVNADTDSITVAKKEGEASTEEERNSLLKELNSLFPEKIKWEDDGYYLKIIVLKAKNYVLYDGKKIKIKGSALKATTKPQALKEFINKSIEYIVKTEKFLVSDLISLYNMYVTEIKNMKDIKRWSARKTISDKTLNSERSNEAKLRDAIEGSEINEGDRCWVFYKSDDSLCLVEAFDGDYNQKRLLKNLFDTVKVFETIIDVKEHFKNYSLKKNLIDFEQKF